MTLKETSKLARILRFIYKMISLNYDYFIVITGDEGVGKSRGIFLNIIDYWYKQILKIDLDTNCYDAELKGFVKLLKKGKEFDFRGLDEAGDKLDTQDYANQLNKIMYQSYTVIRERKYFTALVLPSIFDLNPRFRKRRVRLLIHVYKRVNNKCKDCKTEFVGDVCPQCKSTNFKPGYVIFKAWNRKKLRLILAKNEKRFVKTLNVGVKPIATGKVYVYHGELEKRYNQIKKQKTEDALTNMQAQMNKVTEDNPRRCTECNSLDTRYIMREDKMRCRSCGFKWTRQDVSGGGKV